MQIAEKDGIEALTIGRLAEQLGVAAGAIYRYFGSKDAVLAGLQTDAVQHLGAQLVARAQAATALCAHRRVRPEIASLLQLLAAADTYSLVAEREPARYRLFALMLADPRVLVDDREGARVLETAAPVLSHVAMLFSAAVAAGALSPGESLPRGVLFWAGLQGVMQLGKLDRLAPGLFAPAHRMPAMAVTLLAGWGADAQKLSRAERWVRETRIAGENLS